jgi:outer membrane protein assembly factor BamB
MKKKFTLAATFAALFVLQACSTTSQTVRIPSELAANVEKYPLVMDWQILIGQMAAADGKGLAIAQRDQRLYVASSSGMVTALKTENQPRFEDQVLWQVYFEAGLLAGPVLHNDRLILGSAKGDVFALSTSDGQIQWQTQLQSEVVSRPVIVENKILVRTNDGRLIALDDATGQVVWVADYQMPNLFLRGAAEVQVVANQIFIGREAGFVESLSLQTGERLWETRLALPKGRTDLERMVDVQASLLYDSERLYALSFNGRLAAINPNNGLFLWVKDLSGYRDFLIYNQVLYVFDEDDVLHAIDPVTGTTYWTQDALRYRGVGDIKLDWHFQEQATLRVTDTQGYIHWLSTKDGLPVSRFKHASDTESGQQILQIHQDKTRYYVLDADGWIKAYQPNNDR